MFRKIKEKHGKIETIQSYFGLLSHGNTEIIKTNLMGILHGL